MPRSTKKAAANKKKAVTKTAGSKRQLDFDHDNNNFNNEAGNSGLGGMETVGSNAGQQQSSIAFPPATTPVKKLPKTTTAMAVVTPSDQGQERQKNKDEIAVPIHIHKNLGYATAGKTGNLSETTIQALDWICQTHKIPADLRNGSATKYGPLSGTCFEQKVLQMYTLNRLEPKPEVSPDAATQICIACAEQGHVRDDCPLLI